MKTIHTEIEINAPAEKVWGVLTDFAAFPSWNPFVRRIVGVPAVGEHLNIFVQPQGSKGMGFTPAVLASTPNQELRWLGHLLLPGIFDGEHIFRIEALDANRVRFVQEEHFRGFLVPLFARSLEGGSRAGFEAMNQALKLRVEQSAVLGESAIKE